MFERKTGGALFMVFLLVELIKQLGSFEKTASSSIPVTGKSQDFLSLKLYTQDTFPITSKKEVKDMLVRQLIFKKKSRTLP